MNTTHHTAGKRLLLRLLPVQRFKTVEQFGSFRAVLVQVIQIIQRDLRTEEGV